TSASAGPAAGRCPGRTARRVPKPAAPHSRTTTDISVGSRRSYSRRPAVGSPRWPVWRSGYTSAGGRSTAVVPPPGPGRPGPIARRSFLRPGRRRLTHPAAQPAGADAAPSFLALVHRDEGARRQAGADRRGPGAAGTDGNLLVGSVEQTAPARHHAAVDP